jgi:hypothetical protein
VTQAILGAGSEYVGAPAFAAGENCPVHPNG